MSIHDEVNHLLRGIDLEHASTLADDLRHFLVMRLGAEWQDCSLQANTLADGREVYLAMLIRSQQETRGGMGWYTRNYMLIAHIIDRDENGMFLLSTWSPVAGDMDRFL